MTHRKFENWFEGGIADHQPQPRRQVAIRTPASNDAVSLSRPSADAAKCAVRDGDRVLDPRVVARSGATIFSAISHLASAVVKKLMLISACTVSPSRIGIASVVVR